MKTQWLAVAVMLCAGAAFAAVPSGPKETDAVAALPVQVIAGDSAGQEVDYAAQRKDEPTVYVFVQAKEFDRPMFRFIKQLDTDLPGEAKVVAVWLTDDADASKEYLPKITQYFKNAALTVHGDANGPTGWSINNAARLTAVVANKGKVVKSFGYDSLNETDAKDVVAALKAAAGK